MRKVLVHCAMPFYGIPNVSKILKQNLVNNNTGNLLYFDGVARAIMTSDCEITTIDVTKKQTEETMDMINNVYDMCVIPLANAFREEYVKSLQNITAFVDKLKIPCVVACCGAQKKSGGTWDDLALDKEIVQTFIRSVLSKSALIGVRGYETAKYLEFIGFKQERDFTVVGCPSMYLYGDNLPVPKHIQLTKESKVSISLRAFVKPELYRFILEQRSLFPNYTMISQIVEELRTLYVSYPYEIPERYRRKLPADWPIHVSDPEMASGKMIGVLCPETWINYLKTRDFVFGTRIHGNIAGVLAGIPTYIITDDTRVQELAEYHNIPHTVLSDLKEGTTIFDLYEHADYSKLYQGHADRVTKWLDFLDKNGIPHITREELNSNCAPYDLISEKIIKTPIITSFSTVDAVEQERRIKEYVNATK